MRIRLVFLYVDSCLMYQSFNILGKIAVKNIGCVSAYFCGGHKNNLRL